MTNFKILELKVKSSMFMTTRHFYPRGIEGEAMDCTFKQFDSIDKAIKYANRYAKGKRFAGVQITDDSGEWVYEITADFEVFDYRDTGKER